MSSAPPFATGVVNYDVDGDGFVVPIDALQVINELNRNGATVFNPFRPGEQIGWYDVNGDGWVSPIDALVDINWLNANGAGPAPDPVPVVNMPPVCYTMSLQVAEGGSVSFVPACLDPEGSSMTFSVTDSPDHGQLFRASDDMTFSYQSNSSLDDTFTIVATDPFGLTAASVVTVDVSPSPGPHAPSAIDDRVDVPQDTQVTFNVLTNDSDSDGDPIAIVSVGTPSPDLGTLEDLGSGNFRYTPDVNVTGTSVFTYTIRDPGGLEDSATVTLDIDLPQTQHFVGPLATRAEAVVVAVDLNGGAGAQSGQTYTDINSAYWAYAQIEMAVDRGWLQGGFAVGDTFYPERNVTLGETAFLIDQAYALPGDDFVTSAVNACVLRNGQDNRLADAATEQEFWEMYAAEENGNACSVSDSDLTLLARNLASQFGASF